jgi:arabinofuranosyltransferase
VVAVFPIAGLLSALYVVAVGGDYVHARLLMPALFALCAPVAVIPATRRYVGALLVAPWVVVSVLVFRPPQLFDGPRAERARGAAELWGSDLRAVRMGAHGPHRRWYTAPPVRPGPADSARLQARRRAGRGVGSAADRGTAGGRTPERGDGTACMSSTRSDSATASPRTSKSRGPNDGSRLPGHEKPLPTVWIVARLTPEGSPARARDFADRTVPLIRTTTGAAFDEQVAWARAALRCGDISRLMQSSEGAFGVRRLATNFIDAFRNTRMRIPPDPEQAYRRYCHAGTALRVTAVGERRTDPGERAVTDPSRRDGTFAFGADRRIGSDEPPAVRAPGTRPTDVGAVRARSPPRGEVACRSPGRKCSFRLTEVEFTQPDSQRGHA